MAVDQSAERSDAFDGRPRCEQSRQTRASSGTAPLAAPLRTEVHHADPRRDFRCRQRRSPAYSRLEYGHNIPSGFRDLRARRARRPTHLVEPVPTHHEAVGTTKIEKKTGCTKFGTSIAFIDIVQRGCLGPVLRRGTDRGRS